MMNTASPKIVSPRDVWMRTHVFQEGHMLHAVTYLVAAQNPEVFRVSVDLRPIAAAVVAYHRKLEQDYHATSSGDCIGCDEAERAEIEGCVGCGGDPLVGGFFGSIGKVIKSVGKSKLLNKVAKVGKAVIKSKVTGAALIGLTTVFPPVGAPALGAYVAANAALAAVDKANSLKRGIQRAVQTAKVLPTAPQAVALQKIKVNVKAQAKIKKIGERARAAKKFIATQRAVATYSPDPVKKAEAKKAVHILSVVAQHREKLKNAGKKSPKKGTTGLVVDGRGRIVRGRFVKEEAKKGAELQIMLAARGKVLPGYFRKIGGCVGCF